MAYEIEIDQEITIGDKTYSVFLEADLEYHNEEDPEPKEVEITKAEIAEIRDEEAFPLPIGYSGRAIEKLIVEGNPTLTEAIDNLLWDEIQRHTEDNYRDIMRDLRDAYDERDL